MRTERSVPHVVIALTIVVVALAAGLVTDDSAETILLSFATSLFAVEVLQLIWWLAGGEPLRRGVDELRVQSSKIQALIPEEVRTAAPKLRLLQETGIDHIHRMRGPAAQNNYESWEERAAGAREIDLLGLTMYSEWLQQEALRETLARVAKAGGSVRILVLDAPPGRGKTAALNSRVRVEQPGEEAGILLEELRSAHRELDKLSADLSKHDFEFTPMRRCYPTSMIVRIGDYMFVAPYLATGSGRDSLAFEVSRGGFLYETYAKEFAMIWKAERSTSSS